MPSFGVNVVVVKEGAVLLQQRADLPLWNLPGGRVEEGESLAAAAIREVREETGLVVRPTRLVGVYSRPLWRDGGNHTTLFAAEVDGGDLRDADPAETRDVRFFPPAALPAALVWWNRPMIDDALAGRTVARTLDLPWPGESAYHAVVARLRREPDFAARLTALFCDPPSPGQERLEVGG